MRIFVLIGSTRFVADVDRPTIPEYAHLSGPGFGMRDEDEFRYGTYHLTPVLGSGGDYVAMYVRPTADDSTVTIDLRVARQLELRFELAAA